MKYLGIAILFIITFNSNAQFLSNEFLMADLEKSSFELCGWDELFSEKDQLALISNWRVGELSKYSPADTTIKDYVIFPARYVAKAGFEGLVVTSGEEFKKLALNEKGVITITEDIPVLSMFMIPEKMGLANVHQLLIKTFENSLLISLKTKVKQASSMEKLSFFGFRKSYEKNAIGIHYMILDQEMAEYTDEDFAELSDLKVFQFHNKSQPTKKLGEGMIVAYALPIPKTWKGETLCTLLNTKYGVMHSESFPESKTPRRLNQNQVQDLLNALIEENSKCLFMSGK
ncbi:MAG: hypothetical protein O2984_06030 [Bacteroidetes bacterium]|nr:hypothetical protein [Bacteroidota bacterium]